MRDRTADLLRAKQALSQLSYSPIYKALILNQSRQVLRKHSELCDVNLTMSDTKLVGLSGLEPPTSPLSGVRSNQLSYKPTTLCSLHFLIR